MSRNSVLTAIWVYIRTEARLATRVLGKCLVVFHDCGIENPYLNPSWRGRTLKLSLNWKHINLFNTAGTWIPNRANKSITFSFSPTLMLLAVLIYLLWSRNCRLIYGLRETIVSWMERLCPNVIIPPRLDQHCTFWVCESWSKCVWLHV